jgi:hypothetical protein
MMAIIALATSGAYTGCTKVCPSFNRGNIGRRTRASANQFRNLSSAPKTVAGLMIICKKKRNRKEDKNYRASECVPGWKKPKKQEEEEEEEEAKT